MEALILTAVSESGVEVRLSETTGGYRVERIGLAAPRWTTASWRKPCGISPTGSTGASLAGSLAFSWAESERSPTRGLQGDPVRRWAFPWTGRELAATPAASVNEGFAATGTPHVHPPIRSCPEDPLQAPKALMGALWTLTLAQSPWVISLGKRFEGQTGRGL